MTLRPITSEKSSSSVSSNLPCSLALLGWWFFFGLIHEVSHLLAASLLGSLDDELHSVHSICVFLVKALFGRACSIPLKDQDDHTLMIRHAGWITSVTIAFACLCFAGIKNKASSSSSNKNNLLLAATVTAFEALCTDLLGFGLVQGVGASTLFCGNFGVIVLNSAWTADQGKYALDLLEEMVRITMMRGAQSGGIVAWTTANGKNGQVERRGIRSRVVNGKRTDLSVRLRKQIEKDVLTFMSRSLKPGIRAFLGHTRFATTSKATFDGTHPHQWTPPRQISTYDLNDTSYCPQPSTRRVETFITHNGDLDFYQVAGVVFSLEDIQAWLKYATGEPMKTSVDSAAIAGLMDLIRSAGSFALSVRYALLLDSPHSQIEAEPTLPVPTWKDFEEVGDFLDVTLAQYCQEKQVTVAEIRASLALQEDLAKEMTKENKGFFGLSAIGDHFVKSRSIEEAVGTTMEQLMQKTVKAFFHNDLFESTRIFMKRATGSFGLMVTCSLDAEQEVCIAARGQPMSIAFYPKKGVIAFGSEQAAVKAGLSFSSPAGDSEPEPGAEMVDKESYRLDLNDLNGEVVLLNWGKKKVPIKRDQCFKYTLMNGGLEMTLYQPLFGLDKVLLHRLTPLEDETLIQPPFVGGIKDPILRDIKDIPKICQSIQDSWSNPSLNRLASWNLSRRLRERLQDRVNGKIPSHGGTVDILLTGCEVSLWVAEQFASDLQKAFPKLFIKSMSSNKLLGVFGQELPTPAIGHPVSREVPDLQDCIVIIVSHSGGTFAPLACSNLLQSVTKNIFLVTSEWDTQIGKQLRNAPRDKDDKYDFSCWIFSTECGIRPAEPCSLTVVATHQMLTNLFQCICVVMSDPYFRNLSGAVITESDIRILERCNRDNITALEQIVGAQRTGKEIHSTTEAALREAGKRWSKHVLENVKAYIMAFVYIIGTVTSGYPLVSGISIAAGVNESGWELYVARFFDSLIYFFLPQICITILRLIEGRTLLHRMVARTVVIGDCPWVSQSAEAFLSKIFARSYSIAGLNVISGNPSDHLVHRHTHRVTRGTLLVCGRPDGRLAALTSAEMAVVLSMSQASSIQSLGGTCESVTIGHNSSETSLSYNDIFLRQCRPKFLCEQLLEESAPAASRSLRTLESSADTTDLEEGAPQNSSSRGLRIPGLGWLTAGRDRLLNLVEGDQDGGIMNRSSHSIKGDYLTMSRDSKPKKKRTEKTATQKAATERNVLSAVVNDMTKQHEDMAYLRGLFNEIDADGSGTIDCDEFVTLFERLKRKESKDKAMQLYHEQDFDNGGLNFDAFVKVARMADVEVERSLVSFGRDARGLVQVEPSTERYFGERLRNASSSVKEAYALSKSQHFSMELYESRVASMQRYVAMCVMFHELGGNVEGFFRTLSCGLLGYQMDRTHSIMRIATTASPVSGAEVRDRMERLRLTNKVRNAVRTISTAWISYEKRKVSKMKENHESSRSLGDSWQSERMMKKD